MRNLLPVVTSIMMLGAGLGVGGQTVAPSNQRAGAGTVYVVNNQASNARDDNPGTEARPLKTIQAAADRARPGDTVLVKAGIYREQVVPRRGGTSPQRPITYRAAPGEQVSIRGSERITTWKDQGGGVWMVELATAFFKGYNPFAIPVAGKWLHRVKHSRLGAVYCNGRPYRQKATLAEMKATAHTWYTDLHYGYANKFDFPADRHYPGDRIQIWANFGDVNPNTAMTEINARAAGIFPEKAGLKYIVIDGFDIRHTAPQWADIYTTEYGAIGTRYGYGWTIQNCTISDSRNVGISLGVTDEVHFPRGDEGGLLEGGGNIPPMDQIGHHLIRHNVITRCGQTGIYGCYGAVACVIENNVISQTNYANEWVGSNQAAIKILFAIDTLIRDNLLVGMAGLNNGAKGIWLDWGAQNARVTGNVICDFGSNQGLFLEVDFGPTLVDHNVIVRSDILIEANGAILAHNLFDDCSFLFMASPNRTVPYFKPHSTVRAGKTGQTLRHNRIYNNLVIGKAGLARNKLIRNNADASGIDANDNVYLGGAGPLPGKDTRSVVVASPAPVQLNIGERPVTMKLDLPAAALSGKHLLVTAKRIGRIPLAEMFMEHPDGSPLDLTRDFFGKPINPNRVRPGPFQNIRAGTNRLSLWPKPGP